jgi:hypothetical protein
MQHTILPGSGPTCRTGDRGYLFGREFALLHSQRMHIHPVASLYIFAHCLALDVYAV